MWRGREEGRKEGRKERGREERKKWREGGDESPLRWGAEGNTEQKQINPETVLGLTSNTTLEEKQNYLLRRKGKS